MNDKRLVNKQYFIDLLIKQNKANGLIKQLIDVNVIEGFVKKHIIIPNDVINYGITDKSSIKK